MASFSMRRSGIHVLSFVFLLAVALTVWAQDKPDPQAYIPINPPLQTETAGKIEVIEFFSYACGHCYLAHSVFKHWAAQLPEDVVFRRIPVSGRASYDLMARAYYALEQINALEALDDAVFLAIHSGHRPAFTHPASLAEWVARKGFGSEEDFLKTLGSSQITDRIRRDQELFSHVGAKGVPSVVVDGRYLVAGKSIKTFYDILIQANLIIAMRRAERAQP